MNVSGIPNNGSPQTITFPTKVVNWVKFQIAGASGSANNGLAEFDVYGQPMPIVSLNATATASSASAGYPASNAIDGNLSTEWASASEVNPWIQLNWNSPQAVSQIVINDKANSTDWSQGGTLTFSDGSSLNVSGIPNNGSAYAITFPAKLVNWVKFQIAGASGSGSNGLAEFDVYGQPAPNLSLSATATSSSNFGGYSAASAIDGNTATEWASAGEVNPWLRLDWSTPQVIGEIVINDRVNGQDWSQGGTLTFSDGSSMNVSGIPNNGSPYTIDFPLKTASWVKFQIAGASGSVNNGLAEFDVHGLPAAAN